MLKYSVVYISLFVFLFGVSLLSLVLPKYQNTSQPTNLTQQSPKEFNWCSEQEKNRELMQDPSIAEMTYWISSEYANGMHHVPTIRHFCKGFEELFVLDMEWDDTAPIHQGVLRATRSANTIPITSTEKDPVCDIRESSHMSPHTIPFSIDEKMYEFNEEEQVFVRL